MERCQLGGAVRNCKCERATPNLLDLCTAAGRENGGQLMLYCGRTLREGRTYRSLEDPAVTMDRCERGQVIAIDPPRRRSCGSDLRYDTEQCDCVANRHGERQVYRGRDRTFAWAAAEA